MDSGFGRNDGGSGDRRRGGRRPACHSLLLQIPQHRLRVRRGVDLRVRLADPPVGTDQVGDPAGTAGGRVVARTVRDPERARRVTQQRVGEVELLSEGGVLGDGVERDPDDGGVLFREALGVVAEPAPLGGSARGVGLGVEPEHQVAPGEIGERDGAVVMILDLERGSLTSFSEHGGPPGEEHAGHRTRGARAGQGATTTSIAPLPPSPRRRPGSTGSVVIRFVHVALHRRPVP